MNRRGFIGSLFGAVAGVVLEQAIPLGRVWSFPTEIVVPPIGFVGNQFLKTEWISKEILASLVKNMSITEFALEHERDRAFLAGAAWPVGTRVSLRFPQRYFVAAEELDDY